MYPKNFMINAEVLPYERTIFKGTISKETIDYHYDKHHIGYVNKLNSLIKSSEYENKVLKDIVILSYKQNDRLIFNNASQIINHNLYWKSLGTEKKIEPKILHYIERRFQTMENLKEIIIKKGMELFGSGWLWIVENKDKNLEIISTSNAESPIIMNVNILLTIDLWEHAYYIDYRNSREQYLKNIVNKLNWNFANENLTN